MLNSETGLCNRGKLTAREGVASGVVEGSGVEDSFSTSLDPGRGSLQPSKTRATISFRVGIKAAEVAFSATDRAACVVAP